MTYFVNFLVFLFAFCFTEFLAWFIHKYIMHGFLWVLHRGHHQKNPHSFFELNDFFFVFFGILGSSSMIVGWENFTGPFYIGLGITAYGFTYLTVHDIFIHKRFKIFGNTESSYFKAVRYAHKMHHRHLNKHEGEAFGLLWVPKKYFKRDN